jgi:hypothetical protein
VYGCLSSHVNCPLMPIARGQPEEGGGDPAQVEEGVGPLAADFFLFLLFRD